MNTNSKNELTVQDPVCGMWIEPEDAADLEFYKDRIFYFCAPHCKKDFNENPEKFIIQKKESYEE